MSDSYYLPRGKNNLKHIKLNCENFHNLSYFNYPKTTQNYRCGDFLFRDKFSVAFELIIETF